MSLHKKNVEKRWNLKDLYNYIYSSLSELDEPRSLKKIYSDFVGEGDLVFDIGANQGVHTKIFRKLGAFVIAIEPEKEISKKIKRDNQTIVLNNAVGSAMESKLLNIYSDSGHSTFVTNSPKVREYKKVREEKTDVVTLKYLFERFGYPDFIKIDVEGWEAEVLSTLDVPINLMFEYSNSLKYVGLACIDNLARFKNYKFNYSSEGTHKMVLKEYVTAEEIKSKLEGISRCDIYAKIL